MNVDRFVWLSLALTLWTIGGYAQSRPRPADTSAIMTQLRQAEAIEQQQPQQALSLYRQALEESRQKGYAKGYYASLRLLTYVLDLLGRHQESHQIAAAGLQQALRDTVQEYQSICYFALAQSAKWQGKNKQAIAYFKQAAPYRLAHRDRRKAAALFQNLGLLYETERLFPQAITYFNRALHDDQLAGSSAQDIGLDYASLAAVYMKQRRLELAMRHFRMAMVRFDPVRDRQFLMNTYGNMANLHKELARFDSSLYYYRQARQLNRPNPNPLQELHLLAGEAETYNQMGQFGRAKDRLTTAYALAKQQQVGLAEFRNIYREMANASLGLHDYEGAIPWYDKYLQTKDSLSTIEAKALLADYDLKLRQAQAGQQLAEKQGRIDRLEQAGQRRSLWTLVAALVGVSGLGGLLLAYGYTRQRRQAADSALLAAQRSHALAVAESEVQGQHKERLRIAKEMHDDLGASMTAIGLLSEVVKTRMGEATTPEVEKISTISSEMITTLNEIIWSLNTKNDHLNGLIAYIRAYSSEFIDNTNLDLYTQVAESAREMAVCGTDRRNVFLTVKEALHNVVKHAQATHVTLTIRSESHQLLINVVDNGQGFTPTQQTGLRNGLTNMRQRMRESGGSCTITSSSVGTSVHIVYPYAP
ncbi:ATP-binding protein [Fibrella sp. HMF5335]|uniref:ATP-binding protein n=1 Tax=Fibrella rubiginis TaxID=2817060 RepID=A0A939GFU2_9BACT|nr:ATP-binding protein [Fibrella rubiginis]MBO0936464.1 ATP-binding protein [Fibrella rubiginis]